MLALVGGYDYYTSKFNRVTQALRQPGSGFKPFIYSAALEKGFTAASLINDAPVVFNDPSLEGAWRPENYSGKFFGPTRLRYALTKSRNLVSIRLLRSIGIEYALKYVSRFGFDPDKLPHNLSLALGSANVNPLQMARGYSALANGGFLIDPYLITRIVRNGETAFEAQPRTACPDCPYDPEKDVLPLPGDEQHAPRIITPQNRYLMYSMMQDVIRHGTGVRARVLGRKDIAGKTGTTNDQRDAWFNGYNQSIVANVWVGFDNNDKLGRGEVGGRAALPAWIDYMRVMLDGTPDLPPDMPDGMVTVKIDAKTGKPAAPSDPDAILEIFREGNEPQETSTVNGERAPGQTAPGTTQPLDLF
jgi:penicillin-binding protein 1A